MMAQLITMIAEYRLAIMIGILALLILVSRKKFGGNKFLLILAGALALSIIYEIVMDEPASRMPNRINRTLNQSGPTPTNSSNPRYYMDPEERYNLPQK
ncbi:MAG: hypothetical protein U9P36_06875 [Thermodesulfobacteriota bacterium]|nr:hypothetical protein [Thermodesulfobacteriota bacterium]